MRQWFVHYSMLSKLPPSTRSKLFHILTDPSALTESSMLSSGWKTSCHTMSLWEENTPTQWFYPSLGGNGSLRRFGNFHIRITPSMPAEYINVSSTSYPLFAVTAKRGPVWPLYVYRGSTWTSSFDCFIDLTSHSFIMQSSDTDTMSWLFWQNLRPVIESKWLFNDIFGIIAFFPTNPCSALARYSNLLWYYWSCWERAPNFDHCGPFTIVCGVWRGLLGLLSPSFRLNIFCISMFCSINSAGV